MEEYNAYTQMLRDRGAFVGGEALQPTATATTVRIRDGQTMTTDGPFAETKEALGGFYLIEAKDLDEALALGGACPGAKWGSIEVRPIVDFERPAPALTVRRPRLDRGRRPRGRRPPVPRGIGPGRRDADPGPRRLRPRRGGGPGRVREGARGLARAQGVPRQPGGVDHDDRAERGDRPASGAGAASPRRPTSCSATPRSSGVGAEAGERRRSRRTASTTGCA